MEGGESAGAPGASTITATSEGKSDQEDRVGDSGTAENVDGGAPSPDRASSSSGEEPSPGAPYAMTERTGTQPVFQGSSGDVVSASLISNAEDLDGAAAAAEAGGLSPTAAGGVGSPGGASSAPSSPSNVTRGRPAVRTSIGSGSGLMTDPPMPARCINPASEINARLDTQVDVRVYPCNNSQSGGKKKYTGFTIKPEGVIIQGNNRNRSSSIDLGAEYAMQIGRKLQRYELSDTRACQLLVTTHGKSFWVVPAPEAFSRHSGTCRLLGDRKHPPAPHTLQVGDFLRVGSVGVVVIETHDGVENRVLSEEKIQKIMKDTTNSNGSGFLDLGETDGGKLSFILLLLLLYSRRNREPG